MKTEELLARLSARHPGETEYLQAVGEVMHSVEHLYDEHSEGEALTLAERLGEPGRVYTFKVPWADVKGRVQVNTGCRVQFNNAIRPYQRGGCGNSLFFVTYFYHLRG